MAAKFFGVKLCIYRTLFFLNCYKYPFRCHLVCHIQRRKTWKSPYLDTGFLEVTKTYSKILESVLLSSLNCSQIWIFSYFTCGYITFGKKKTLVGGCGGRGGMQPGWSQENGHGRQCDGSQCKHSSELQFQEASLASCCPEMQHVQSCVRFLAHALPHLLNPRASPCGPQTCCECHPHHHHLQISIITFGVCGCSLSFSLSLE